MKSLRMKFITTIMSILIVMSTLLIIICAVGCTKVMDKSIDAFMMPYAEQAATTVDTFISQQQSAVQQLTSNTLMISSEDPETIQRRFSYISEESLLEYAVYNCNEEAYFTFGDNIETAFEQECFQKAVTNQRLVMSTPITISTGELCYLAYFPVISNESVCKVIVCIFTYSGLNDIVNNINFGEDGSAYLIYSDGTIVSNKDIDALVAHENYIEQAKTSEKYKEIASIHKKFLNGKSESQKYEFNGKDMISSAGYVEPLDGYLILSSTQRGIFDTRVLIFVCAAVGLVTIACSIIVSNIVAKRITQPITSISQRLKELSEGNLSDPVKKVKTKDELNILAKSLEDTITALRTYVSTISDALTRISEGDLTDRMHGNFKGDFIKIKSTFNTILASLIDTFGNINSAAEQVNSGANQVSNGAQALSQGATEQASAIEQLSATIADVSDQIKSNAKAAKTAAEIVDENTNQVNNCDTDMKNMLTAMDEIGSSSNEISKIIKVIDDIAFQTNILALNAAVEAARAGAAGKGFAVVADEVRSLAAKSAEAAKQTTQLIQSSVDTVDKGTKIAKQTADALVSIVDSSNKIDELVQNISQASSRQAEAVIQINSGVEQISGVIQTNTATAEESAAASEELSGQSLLLKNMVSKFRLGDKEKLFGANAVHVSGSGPVVTNNFAFNDSTDNTASGIDSPADDEFAFGGSVSEDKPSEEEFAFAGNVDDDKPQDDEFAFGENITDDISAKIDDEDTKY